MERADIICVGNLGVPLVNVSYNGKSKSRFIGKHLGRTSWTACPSFSLSLLFVTLGAGLLRLVCFQGNINALADIVQLGNLGAGFFQLGIFRCSLPAEGGVLLFPFSDRQALCPFRQICMEIAARCVPSGKLG